MTMFSLMSDKVGNVLAFAGLHEVAAAVQICSASAGLLWLGFVIVVLGGVITFLQNARQRVSGDAASLPDADASRTDSEVPQWRSAEEVGREAERHAEILTAVRDANAAGPHACVTFTVAGNGDKYIQYIDGTLNAAYPRDEDPMVVMGGLNLQEIGDLEAWDPGVFATFTVHDSDARQVAEWIHLYFVAVLECKPSEFDLKIKRSVLA